MLFFLKKKLYISIAAVLNYDSAFKFPNILNHSLDHSLDMIEVFEWWIWPFGEGIWVIGFTFVKDQIYLSNHLHSQINDKSGKNALKSQKKYRIKKLLKYIKK
jgi:hypothetical protein